MVHELIDSNNFQKSNIPKDPEPCTPKKATTETWDHWPSPQHTNPKFPSMYLNETPTQMYDQSTFSLHHAGTICPLHKNPG